MNEIMSQSRHWTFQQNSSAYCPRAISNNTTLQCAFMASVSMCVHVWQDLYPLCGGIIQSYYFFLIFLCLWPVIDVYSDFLLKSILHCSVLSLGGSLINPFIGKSFSYLAKLYLLTWQSFQHWIIMVRYWLRYANICLNWAVTKVNNQASVIHHNFYIQIIQKLHPCLGKIVDITSCLGKI